MHACITIDRVLTVVLGREERRGKHAPHAAAEVDRDSVHDVIDLCEGITGSSVSGVAACGGSLVAAFQKETLLLEHSVPVEK